MRGIYGILLIVLLVAVSGLIAYVGDILGRRLGRRRLSLFGMRPRHTAIAVSVVAGMLITLFTLGAAMLVSRDVKDGFLRVEQMRTRQAELSSQVNQLNRRVSDLDKSRRTLEDQLNRGKAELGKGRAELDAARAKLDETKKAQQKAEAELAQRKTELARTKSELAKSTEAMNRASLVFKRMVASQTQIQNELQSRIDVLRSTASRAEREYALERAIPIILGAGQPLDVELMSGGQSVAAARRELDNFVTRLNAKVAAIGAKPLPGSSDAVIVSKPVRDPKTNQVSVAKESQVLDAVANRVHDSSGDVIVRAVSVFNSHPAEPVYIDFELFRNLLVFRKGETLAVTVVDGHLSEPTLMGQLVHLLRDEVGAKAREKNVMPRLSAGSPNLFGSTGEKVGEMTYDDLFDVIRQLRRVDAPARVAAVAAEDAWTIGPLKVDLRVEPVTAPAAR